MKLVQLTDPHLDVATRQVGGRDPVANLVRALGEIRTLHADAELVVITGDLSETGAPADYEALAGIIDDYPIPVELLVGNHDDRDAFAAAFPHRLGADGFVQGSRPLSAGTAVHVDTLEAGTHAGGFCAARAAWLDRTLAEAEAPVFLFLHHNPIPTGVEPLDRIMLRDDGRFADVVAARQSSIAQIFHGHVHLPLAGSLHGVPTFCPRGTNHAGYPAFGAERLPPLSDLPQAYAVCQVNGPAVSIAMVEFAASPE